MTAADTTLPAEAYAIADATMLRVLGERFSEGSTRGLWYALEQINPERTLARRHLDAILWLQKRGLIEIGPDYAWVRIGDFGQPGLVTAFGGHQPGPAAGAAPAGAAVAVSACGAHRNPVVTGAQAEVQAPAIPGDWTITRREGGEILVCAPSASPGGLHVRADDRPLAARVLYALADALLASSAWRAMAYAPHEGTEVELLLHHPSRRYAEDDAKGQWEQIVRAKWIDFNGGGWTWHGMYGVPVGWRPVAGAGERQQQEPEGPSLDDINAARDLLRLGPLEVC